MAAWPLLGVWSGILLSNLEAGRLQAGQGSAWGQLGD